MRSDKPVWAASLENKMAPVNGDVKWRCVIVYAILSVLLFERIVCVYTYDRKDLLHILQTVNCEYRPKLLYFSDDFSRDNTHTQKGALFNAIQLVGVHANGVGVWVC